MTYIRGQHLLTKVEISLKKGQKTPIFRDKKWLFFGYFLKFGQQMLTHNVFHGPKSAEGHRGESHLKRFGHILRRS